MGSIEFEGWVVEVDDINALNSSREVHRLGLVFVEQGGHIFASARGNVSSYYSILCEVRRRLVSGSFNVSVELSSGEKREIILAKTFVRENDDDITSLIH